MERNRTWLSSPPPSHDIVLCSLIRLLIKRFWTDSIIYFFPDTAFVISTMVSVKFVLVLIYAVILNTDGVDSSTIPSGPGGLPERVAALEGMDNNNCS